MNYYNQGFYPNYQYGGNQYQAAYQPQPSLQPSLNGKMVDSLDIVKATEVPIGGYGVFPKADLSEIYIKTWYQNGTTSILTFKPYIPPEPIVETTSQNKEEINAILEKINNLENKIDAALGQMTTMPAPAAKKERSANDY